LEDNIKVYTKGKGVGSKTGISRFRIVSVGGFYYYMNNNSDFIKDVEY
jgi:hypothetical protein